MRSDLRSTMLEGGWRAEIRSSLCARVLQQPIHVFVGRRVGSPNTSRKGREERSYVLRIWPASALRSSPSCRVMRSCVPSWMTSTSQVCQAGSQKHHCGPTQASTSTTANQSVELWWCGVREHCATDQIGMSVWKGDPELPRNQQGLRVLGAHWPTRVRQRFLGR